MLQEFPRLSNPRYRLVEPLGSGGQGEVWRAVDQADGGAVAVKVAAGPDGLESLETELLAATGLFHPAWPAALDLLPGERPALVLELVDGRPPAVESLPAEILARLAVRLLLALRALHARGLLHGDLKPDNVLLPPGPPLAAAAAARLIDLGLARPPHRADGRTVSGTPAFLAPEERAGGAVDERADLHALGLTLACLRAGLPEPERAVAQLDDSPLGLWLRELLAPRPAQRPASVDAALARGVELGAVEAPPSSARLLAPAPPLTGSAAAVLVDGLDRARVGRRPVVLLGGGSIVTHRRLLDHLTARTLREGGRRFTADSAPALARRLAAERGDEAGSALEELVLAAGRGARPLVAALEIGEESELEEAGRLAAEAPEGCLVVLLGPRPGQLDELERRLADREPARADETRLGTDEVADWLGGVLGSEPPGAGELARALRRATGGEPDALARCVDALAGEELLRCDAGGRWSAGDLATLEAQARAAARPDAAPPERLAPLLALAHWAGEELDLGRAAAAAGLDAWLVQDALASGRARRGRDGRLRAASPAAAAACAEGLRPAEREALARRLLDGAGAGLPSPVRARALEACEEWDRAAQAWEEAGAESLAGGRAEEAVTRHEAAAAAATRSGRSEESAASLEAGTRLGRALLAAGRTERAREWLEALLGRAADTGARLQAGVLAELAEACEQSGDEEAATAHARSGLDRLGPRGSRSGRARLLVLLGRIAGKRREADGARRHLERALELARAAGDDGLVALALVERAHVELLLGESRVARHCADEALEAGRRVGDESLVGRALQLASRAAAAAGREDEAIELVEDAARRHRAAGDLTWELNALSWLATLQGRTGRADRAAEAHRRVLGLARRVGEPAHEAATLYHLGLHAHRQGDWAEAESRLREAAGTWRGLDRPDLEAAARRVLGNLLRDRGELDAGEAEYEAAERLLPEDSPLRPLLQRSRAAAALERGDAAEAGDRARAALAVHEPAGQDEGAADARRLLAEALLLRGHAEEAFAEADRAARLSAEGHPTVRARALEARARARAALPLDSAHAVPGAAERGSRASRRDAAVDEDLRTALALHEEAGSPFDAARARLVQARILLDSGRARMRGRDAAQLQRALADARDTLQRLGASSLSAAAAALLERAEAGSDEDARTLATLYEVTRVLNSSLERREVLERALDLLLPTLDVERAALILVEPGPGGEEELRVAARRGVDDDTSADALTYSRTVVFDVKGRGEPLVSPDATQDPRFARAVSVARHSIGSLACVPLRVGDEVRGALYVDDRRALRRFGEDDVRFLRAFADVAAPAIENARLVEELRDARDRLEAEALDLRSRVRERFRFEGMVGESAAMERVYESVQLVADSTASVLITGENGVGKELVARAVHEASRRKEGPFTALNCAALPETLLEAELFGIEKGTATGVTGKIGKFEQSEGGTLFLDEIGDMSIGMQARLLRVLQEKSFMRVGGDRLITVDVRVVAATNRNLAKAVEEGTFRQDLFYRLNVVPIVVPSLRERREDVPLLLDHFIAEFAKELPPGPDGRPAAPPEFTPAVRELLAQADWPGNVRQLRNLVHRLVLICAGRRVEIEDLPPELRGAREEMLVEAGRQEATMDEIKRRYAQLMLERCGGNKRKTARTLGIAFKTLQGYLGEG